jgi:hypothetical protein
MTISKKWGWLQPSIRFWSGVAVISLVNIVMIVFHHNQLLYDEYILGISLVVIVIALVIRRSGT